MLSSKMSNWNLINDELMMNKHMEGIGRKTVSRW